MIVEPFAQFLFVCLLEFGVWGNELWRLVFYFLCFYCTWLCFWVSSDFD